jgi:peptidyl-prolyl cis-trans isomerase B (cyclophilin B)
MELAEAAKAALTNATPSAAPSLAAAPTQHGQVQGAIPAVQLQRRQAKTARRHSILTIVGGSVVLLAVVAALVTTLVIRDHKAANSLTSKAPTSGKVSATTEATEPTPSASPTPSVPPLPAFAAPANLGANCQYPPSPDPAGKPAKPPRSGKVPTDPAEVSVTMATNQGDISMQLANAKSPCTVNSFVSLAQQGFFDSTHCHRLTTSQTLAVLQCGDPKNNGTGGPGYEFANEYPTDQYSGADDPALSQPVLYPRGTLAMANAGPNTNGSQFFLVYDDSELPPEYTVFGTVDDTGLAIIDKVAKAGVIGGGEDGTPVTTVTITSVRLD